MDLEHHSEKQDDITYRRVSVWELKRLSDELDALKSRNAQRSATSWMLPALFAALLTGAVGYVSIVHQMALRAGSRLDAIAEEQYRSSNMKAEVESIQRRLLAVEQTTQQLPYLNKQVNDMNAKMDRYFERMPR